MTKHFCDRCKKEIDEKIERKINISESKPFCIIENYIDRNLCEECMNDFINMINYECDRYVLKSTAIVSKEASDNNV